MRLRHTDHLGLRPVELEAKHVVAIGTAPAVDGLVVVGGDEDGRRQAHQARMRARGPSRRSRRTARARVLQLVDEDVLVAPPVAEHVRVLLEELERSWANGRREGGREAREVRMEELERFGASARGCC